MDKQTSQQRKDAGRKATFIERHAGLYRTNPIWRMMVDGTVYFTTQEQEASQRIIGGQYQDGKFVNL